MQPPRVASTQQEVIPTWSALRPDATASPRVARDDDGRTPSAGPAPPAYEPGAGPRAEPRDHAPPASAPGGSWPLSPLQPPPAGRRPICSPSHGPWADDNGSRLSTFGFRLSA